MNAQTFLVLLALPEVLIPAFIRAVLFFLFVLRGLVGLAYIQAKTNFWHSVQKGMEAR